MPTYDYLCPNGHRFEVIHSVTADGPTTCPICGASPVTKAFSAPTFHFKGSGWAKKDRTTASRRSSQPASASGDGGTGSGADSETGSGSAAESGTGKDSGTDKGSGSSKDGSTGSERKSATDGSHTTKATPKGSSDSARPTAAD